MQHRHPNHTRVHRWIAAVTAVVLVAGVGIGFVVWSPNEVVVVVACALGLLVMGAVAAYGEALTAQWHWFTESRHRIEAGRPEWSDLHTYLHRPHWWFRTTAYDRSVIAHCARPYEDGGRGTHSPEVLLNWLKADGDVGLLVYALEHGYPDAALTAHLAGGRQIRVPVEESHAVEGVRNT